MANSFDVSETLIICLNQIPNFKILYMLNSFKVINTLTSHCSLVLVHCFSSLSQAVTSQTENFDHLKGVLI